MERRWDFDQWKTDGVEAEQRRAEEHNAMMERAAQSMTKNYRKKGTQPMAPWGPMTDMTGVSVSEADKAIGSPKTGDMIAHNPDKPTDRWLVEEAYFRKHFEPVE